MGTPQRAMTTRLPGGLRVRLWILLLATAVALGASNFQSAGAQEASEVGRLQVDRLEFEATVVDAEIPGGVLLQSEDGLALLVPSGFDLVATSRRSGAGPTASDLEKDAAMANVLPPSLGTFSGGTEPESDERASSPEPEADEVASEERSETGIFVLRDPWSGNAGNSVKSEAVTSTTGVDGGDVALEGDSTPAPVNRARQDLSPGDTVEVSVENLEADILALENGLLTVRSKPHGIMQLPASALPEDVRRSVRIPLEGGVVSLPDALRRQQSEGAQVDGVGEGDAIAWRPGEIENGVIAASGEGRLLLVAAVDGKLALVTAPPLFLAGQAVQLVDREGRVTVEHWNPKAAGGNAEGPTVEDETSMSPGDSEESGRRPGS